MFPLFTAKIKYKGRNKLLNPVRPFISSSLIVFWFTLYPIISIILLLYFSRFVFVFGMWSGRFLNWFIDSTQVIPILKFILLLSCNSPCHFIIIFHLWHQYSHLFSLVMIYYLYLWWFCYNQNNVWICKLKYFCRYECILFVLPCKTFVYWHQFMSVVNTQLFSVVVIIYYNVTYTFFTFFCPCVMCISLESFDNIDLFWRGRILFQPFEEDP